MTGMRRFLKDAGVHAEIAPDGFTEGGWVLSIGGAEQSHVDLAHPEEIFYEYLRRIGHVADAVAPEGRPVTAVHLGAGALTLARYVAVTRPGSVQVAVELERELPAFVLEALPLPAGADVRVVVDDARAALPGLVPPGSADLVILDVFAGRDAPAHLTEPSFYAEAAALLRPGGVLAVNVGDDPGLAFFAAQARAVRAALADVWCLADRGMLTGRYPGNLVLVGGTRPLPREWAERFTAAGPHPAGVLDGLGLEELIARR
ncbi:SAM-dependent methyltransferase [Kocuria flava]|uniref:SAM-dependent methyltransferase n=2 Tax=Kocuria flava TaxID=446860 RepID=A0A0U2WP78_9MICC|nr:SAM-dependent methyltransferase [Kocuria flava]GEO92033.1 spermidine synthase [Kocuria flava]